MKRRSTLILATFLSLIGFNAISQTYNMGDAGARTVTGCNLTIYDNGGSAGQYGNNRNDTITILSGNPTTPMVKIKIMAADISADDTLFIYNSNLADPTKLVYMGPLNAPFFNNSNMIIAGDWTTFATIDNASGAITMRFKSNGSTTAAGFQITTSCITPCQRINAFVDTVNTMPHPKRLIPDDGNVYIDLCYGDSIHLVANAFFMDNNIAYQQSLDSCTFNWQLGDAVVNNTMGNTSVDHLYQFGRGYDVVLTIKDQRQCFNLNFAGARVRTSLNPITHISPLPDMCTGTTRLISVGYSDSSNVLVAPVSSIQESSLSFDSVMFVPDGPNCTGLGNCYNTFVTFNSFRAGDTVRYAADILSICFTMEHSYLGDLQFRVVCPDASSVITHPQPNGGGLYLGVPIDDTGGCSPNVNLMGTPWNYCWSDYPSYSYHGTSPNYLYQNQTTRCDSSNRQNHTNYYHPRNSFSGLVGCPLNGTWSIEICDLFGIDDGWITQWQLNLDPALLPTPWTYSIGINNVLWNGAFITQQSDTTALLQPGQAGLYNYTFSVIDDFGCAYDSVMHLSVIETPTPNLGSDTAICNDGVIIIVDPHYGIPGSTYKWNDLTTDNTLPVLYPGTFTVTVTNSSPTIQCKGSDTITVLYHPQPTAAFTAQPTEGCSPLMVQFTDQSIPDTINYNYVWDFGDPNAVINTSDLKNPTHMYNDYGNFDVSLTVTSPYGCTSSITKPGLVTVHPTPRAKFTPTPINASLSDNPNIVFTNQSENYILSETTWNWNFQDGFTSTDMNTNHTYTSPGDFPVTLIVTNSHGCSDSVTHTVIIEDELFIPNILTPNGDGQNDFLVIGNLNLNRENVLKIYDRWGKKVYEKKNYNTTSLCKKTDATGKSWQCGAVQNADQGWNGDGCADGVYFYTFHYAGVIKTVDSNGSITIVGGK